MGRILFIDRDIPILDPFTAKIFSIAFIDQIPVRGFLYIQDIFETFYGLKTRSRPSIGQRPVRSIS